MVIAAGCLGWSSPGFTLQGQGLGQLQGAAARANASLLHNVIVICRVYTTGNIRHTLYCEDGDVCAPNDKCAPGPEKLREMERQREEEARRQAEEQRKREIEEARQAEQARQRAAAARQAELVRQLAQKHTNTPNPFGSASADCSTVTDKNSPQGGHVNCNTGRTSNPFQHPVNRPPAQQAQAPGQHIPGVTLTFPNNSSGASSDPNVQQQVQTQQVGTNNPANNPSDGVNNPQRANSSTQDEEKKKREAEHRAVCAALVPLTDKCEERAKEMGSRDQPNNAVAGGSAEIDVGTGAFRACSLATCRIANENCSDYPTVIKQVCRAFPVVGTCRIEVGFHLFYRADKNEFECQPNRPSYAEPAGGQP